MSEPPQSVEARALRVFLTADPDDWPRLAPRMTEAVGADTLQRIVRATLARVGELDTVTDSPDGLIVSGSRGRVRAWAQAAPDGKLGALRIEGARYTPRRRRPHPPAPVIWAAYLLVVTLWNILTVWTAADRTAWLGDMATLAAFYVIVEGCGAPARQPRPLRRTVEAGAVAALASAWRLPDLPNGHSALRLVCGLALLSASLARGDTVRAGQLLGEVGNSGNTTEPHLHLHAERDGLGLDLEFTGVPGRLHRGRTVRAA
jgi:hypothetical protein